MKVVGIISNRKISEHRGVFEKLWIYLQEKDKEVLMDEHLPELVGEKVSWQREDIIARSDLIITLGGDGTVLKTARLMPNGRDLPVLAVNLGNLGFLTEVAPQKIVPALEQIIEAKHYNLDKRTLLRVTVYREKEKIFTTLALNDAVINQGNFARLIRLATEIDRKKMVYIRADGLIIATPTGATGHSLSAGGPIVHPQIESLIMTPICPAGLGYRSIVIPNDREIKVTLETERREMDISSDVGLTVDGQIVFPLKYGDEIKVRKSNRSFQLIRLQRYNYYRVLRDKLGWGH